MTAVCEDRRACLLGAGVIILGLILFAPALDNGFRADDWQFLAAASSADSPLTFLSPGQDLAFYRPLALALFWLEHRLFGFAAGLFILFNLFLHGLNASLGLVLLRRLGLSRPAAGMGAALFFLGVFHFGKQITWACTSGGLLSVTLILAALLIDLKRDKWRLPLLFILAVLAPFAHELGLFLPLFLLLRRILDDDSRKRAIVETAILATLGGGLWFLGNLSQSVGTPANTLAASGPFILLGRFLGYIGLMLLPIQESMNSRSLPGLAGLVAAMKWLQPLIGLFGVVILIGLIRRGSRAPRFLAAWMLLALLPFAFIPTPAGWLDLRYLYPAALPACALAGLGLFHMFARRRALALALLLLLILMAAGLELRLERSYDRQARLEADRIETLR